MKNKIFFPILILLLSCSDNSEIILKNEYSILPGGSNTELYILRDNQYVDYNDTGLENVFDGISITQIQEENSDIYKHSYHKLILDNATQGRIIRGNVDFEYPISYTVSGDNLLVDIKEHDIQINFKIKKGGDEIESCMYVAAWIDSPRTLQSEYKFFYKIECENLSSKQAAQLIKETYNLSSDTIAVFQIYHHPN